MRLRRPTRLPCPDDSSQQAGAEALSSPPRPCSSEPPLHAVLPWRDDLVAIGCPVVGPSRIHELFSGDRAVLVAVHFAEPRLRRRLAFLVPAQAGPPRTAMYSSFVIWPSSSASMATRTASATASSARYQGADLGPAAPTSSRSRRDPIHPSAHLLERTRRTRFPLAPKRSPSTRILAHGHVPTQATGATCSLAFTGPRSIGQDGVDDSPTTRRQAPGLRERPRR